MIINKEQPAMEHTAQQIHDGIEEHTRLARFVKAAHRGKKTGSRVRLAIKVDHKETTIEMGLGEIAGAVDAAIKRMRSLEEKFGIRAVEIEEKKKAVGKG